MNVIIEWIGNAGTLVVDAAQGTIVVRSTVAAASALFSTQFHTVHNGYSAQEVVRTFGSTHVASCSRWVLLATLDEQLCHAEPVRC
jgi:hypothetical protein